MKETWIDKIAMAEAGNIPYGAIFLGSIAQALCVAGGVAVESKWPEYSKWSASALSGAGAVLVPQAKKVIGEPASKSLAMGCGLSAASPFVYKGINKAIGLFAKPAAGKPIETKTPPKTKTLPEPIPASLGSLAGSADAGTEAREGEE